MSTRVSAPGKMMIIGEYAVLEGAPSLVAAVDRRAHAWWAPADTPVRSLPPEVAAACGLAAEQVGPPRGPLALDLTALRSGDRKLGLGSSAAGAAAATGLMLATHGQDLAAPHIRSSLFDLALRGHRAVAPQGSGADVAAAVWGGFLSFRLTDTLLPEVTPLEWPPQLALKVVWTGQEARTSDLVGKVKAFAARAPESYRERMAELTSLAVDFLQASRSGPTSSAIAGLASYGRAMEALGSAACANIVTPILTQVATLAAQYEGAAKPSGAGGGDVAIAMFENDTNAAAFEKACERLGMSVLPLYLGAPGVMLEPSPSRGPHSAESANR